jgi:glycosyltransferase involved in cell wall biosynthesis
MTVEHQEQREAPQVETGLGRAALVSILIPVLRRPQNVSPVLKSIAATSPPGRFQVLFICDRGDEKEIETIVRASERRPWVRWTQLPPGATYAMKINHGVRTAHSPLYFFGADDLRFTSHWLEHAEERMERAAAGAVGTNDMCNPRVMAGEHATHFLVADWYAKQPLIDGARGPLCEEYPHEYVDDEFIGTAKKRGRYAHAADSIVKHLHPLNGTAPMDDLYAQISDRMARGLPIYERRRALWET